MNVHHATNGFHDANRGRELSREARTLAKLLRLHVAQVLTRHNLRVPTALASELTSSQTAAEKEAANNLLSSGAHEEAAASTITFEKLRTSFDRLVSRFNNKYRSDVQRFVAQIEITLASIELNVVGIVQEIFSDDVVTWGRVVALAGFITSIALECSRAELLQVIEPLIEHTASISEERVTPFVRENGGWVSESNSKSLGRFLLIRLLLKRLSDFASLHFRSFTFQSQECKSSRTLPSGNRQS